MQRKEKAPSCELKSMKINATNSVVQLATRVARLVFFGSTFRKLDWFQVGLKNLFSFSWLHLKLAGFKN